MSKKGNKLKKSKKSLVDRTEFTIKENGFKFTTAYHAMGYGKPNKTEWCIKNTEAVECFKNACLHSLSHTVNGKIGDIKGMDYVWFNDNLNGMCSILYEKNNNGVTTMALRKLGENGERFAFFPKTNNYGETWHGYPVTGEKIQKLLLEYWESQRIISKLDCHRVKKGKL